MLQVLIFLVLTGLMISTQLSADNLRDQYKQQQQKSATKDSLVMKKLEARLLKKVKKSISDFQQTFKGRPRPIRGTALDGLIKTGSTYPVGYILDGPYILRLESRSIKLPSPYFSRVEIPSLVVAAKIRKDGTLEVLGRAEGIKRQIWPHPSSVDENTQRKISIYSKGSAKVYKKDIRLGKAFDNARFISKYFESWESVKFHRDKLPRSVVKFVGDFHAKQVKFCRYYFNRTRWPRHGDRVCRTW